MKPLCIDLYCGLGGWAEGFLAEGYRVVGFDIERHDYGTGGYPGELVLQDALALHGSQFRDAACIVASPPCQEYSYMAMPWSRAKKIAAEYRDGTRDVADLTRLFDTCFRIQREAIEAATMVYGCEHCGVYHPATKLNGCIFTPRHIPLIVENVKGAQPWVGRAAWHYGSYFLWGDVPALMPFAMGRKVAMNFHEYEKTGKPGRSFQSAAVEGLKTVGHANQRDGFSHTRHLTHQAESDSARDGRKQEGSGPAWFDNGIAHLPSASPRRKAASAQIAKIPFPLASHIARVFKPKEAIAC